MKVIWVLENIKDNKNSHDFYINSKLNVLLLLASVNLWRKHHREDTCVLYTDEMTIDFFDKLKVLDLWHEVKLIPQSRNIDKQNFWAQSKLQVLATVEEPVILMDNDTLVYKPFKQHLRDGEVLVTNFEKGRGYYPTAIDKYIRQLSYKRRWKTESINVSFLYLPDYKFTQKYAETSLNMMEEMTALKVPNPQYLIFAEQMLLKQMLDEHEIPYRSIISTYWDCDKWTWGDDHDKGIWRFYDSERYFKHYGPLKAYVKDSRGGQNYESEIKMLENCINLPILDISKIPGR